MGIMAVRQYSNMSKGNAAVDFSKLLADAKTPYEFFSRKDFAVAFFLGLAPSVWDTGSDYYFAETATEENCGDIPPKTVRGLTYAFISLPGLLLAFSFLQKQLLNIFTCRESRGCQFLINGLILIILGVVLAGISFLMLFSSTSFFYLSIPSTIFIIGVKILGLFLHSPEMKKLTIRVSAVESQWEASLQLFLVAFVAAKGGQLTQASLWSILSSVAMIGKVGAESFLTFGQESKLDNLSFLRKIGLLALYSPAFTLTALFRISALAIIVAWGIYYAAIVHWPCALFLPFLALLSFQCIAKSDLSLGHCLQGVITELTTPSLWGNRGREGSYKIQISMAIYLLILNTIFLVWVLIDPTADSFVTILGGPFNPAGASKPVLSPGVEENLLPYVVMCTCIGWLSFPLFFLQTFFMVNPCSQSLFLTRTTVSRQYHSPIPML